MKKTISILTALALFLSLAACGGGPAGGAEQAASIPDAAALAAPEQAYSSAQLPVPEELKAIAGMAVMDETVFLCDSDGALYMLDMDGSVLGQFRLAVAPGAVADMAGAGDGTLWIMTVPQPSPAQAANALCHFDPAHGQVLDSFELPSTGSAPISILADEARERLYVSTRSELLALDLAGNVLFRLAAPVYSLSLAADGTLAALELQMDRTALLTLAPDGEAWDRTLDLGAGQISLYSGGQGHDLLASVDGILCALALDSLSFTPLLDLRLTNVAMLRTVLPLADSRFLLEDSYGPLLYLAQPGGGDAPAVITVAVFGQGVLSPAVVAFNNSQDAYRVVLKDYSPEGSDFYSTDGLERLGLDIASGSGPDILTLDQVPVYQYVRDGLLEDLYPYIDADSDLSRDSLDQGLLAALETDGALYGLAAAVQMPSVITAPGVLDRDAAVTWSGILAALGEDAFAGDGADGLLAAAVCGDLSPFVDWERNVCDFENDEFLALLALARGAQQPEAGGAPRSVLVRSVFGGPGLVQNCRELDMEGGCPVLSGLPGRDGSRYLLSPLFDFAISAQSAHKEGAWAFLRTLLTEPSGLWLGRFLAKGAQTDPAAFQAQLDNVPEEYLARLQDAVDGAFAAANGTYHFDLALVSILREEAAPYFAGQTAARDAAAAIQSRVSLYLSERG